MHTVSIHRPGAPPERYELASPVRAGGSHADELHLPGTVASALRLVPVAAGVVVEAAARGVRVGGRPVHPGARRLLRPGEHVELHGATIVLEPAPAAGGTRVAAAALLRAAAAGEAPVAGAHLVVLSGPSAGSRHPLGAELTLGRGGAASVSLADPHASRVHARIRAGFGGAFVEDLGSKNGVRVNGVRIERQPCPLHPGDEILIGETAVAVGGLDAVAGAPGESPSPARLARRLRPPRQVVAAALLALSAAALALAAG